MKLSNICVIATMMATVACAATPAFALSKLDDEDRVEIMALTEKAEQAIISKDLVALQSLCNPWDGLWIDSGHSGGNPSPIIYYGWDQIPTILEDDHLYFLGWADGSGFPIYGRAPEIVWRGRWGDRQLDGEESDAGLAMIDWPTKDGLSLADIMQENDGRELDAFTREPANMTFIWQDKYHFVQYFSTGEQSDPECPYDIAYDNDFWFLVFDWTGEWHLYGIAHLDGWGI
jgi:hypothetical protein